MKYKVCEYCGGHLDPGEHCDCRKEEEERERFLMKEKGTGRYVFNWLTMERVKV